MNDVVRSTSVAHTHLSDPLLAVQNVVMLTINVPNLAPIGSETNLDLQPSGLDFSGKGGVPGSQKQYAFHLDFFAEIDPQASKIHQTSKSIYLVLRKKETKSDYWPRLSRDKVRMHNVKTDFDKWRDEDEQDELEDVGGGDGGMGGLDPSMLAQMGGMGGMGGGMGGGMPGMPGMGGMGGGEGGMGGMDLQSMLAQMGGGAGGAGGMPDLGGDDDDGDDGDDGDDVAEEAVPADAGSAGDSSSAKISEA